MSCGLRDQRGTDACEGIFQVKFGTTLKTIATVVTLLTVSTGCANNRAASDMMYSKHTPTNEERLKYGRIGIASGRFKVELANVQRVVKLGRRADPEVLALFLMTMALLGPYGLDVDYSSYRWKTLPAAPKKHWASLDEMLSRPDVAGSIQRKFAQAIIERVNTTGTGKLNFLDDYGPNSLGEKVDYSRCADSYDTVFELSITRIGFESIGGTEPTYHLYVSAEIKIVKAATNTVIYHDLFKYSGDGETVRHWTAGDGKYVNDEVAKGIQYLSWQISLLMSPT